MKMMGWTAPAHRHRCAITWSSLNATTRGTVRHANYHDRPGYREESVSNSRCRRRRHGCRSKEAEAVRAAAILRSLAPCLVGIEACATAHHWARKVTALGHQVRLVPPSYVKAYLKRGKNDAAGAE